MANRRDFLYGAMTTAGALLAPATCFGSIFPAKKCTVVMVDTSWTVKSFDPAINAWPGLVAGAKRGDRVVMGLVMGGVPGHREFRLIRDTTLPTFDIFKSTDENEKELREARKYLSSGMAEALKQPRSDRTELLRTCREAARYLSGLRDMDRECIYFSDMLEDSGEFVFEKDTLTEPVIREFIARKRKQRALPDLRNVKFRAAGVTAPTREKEDQVQNFWAQYLGSSGAIVVDYGYYLTGAMSPHSSGAGF